MLAGDAREHYYKLVDIEVVAPPIGSVLAEEAARNVECFPSTGRIFERVVHSDSEKIAHSAN